MKIQLSPNKWSCLLTSFAMALDIDYKILIKMIGHDGSQIIWPELDNPYRAFHPQEFFDCAIELGYCMMEIEMNPYSFAAIGHSMYNIQFKNVERFNHYIHTFNNGVITGQTPTHRRHAVAWDGLQINDPNGHKYNYNLFRPEIFFPLIKMT